MKKKETSIRLRKETLAFIRQLADNFDLYPERKVCIGAGEGGKIQLDNWQTTTRRKGRSEIVTTRIVMQTQNATRDRFTHSLYKMKEVTPEEERKRHNWSGGWGEPNFAGGDAGGGRDNSFKSLFISRSTLRPA